MFTPTRLPGTPAVRLRDPPQKPTATPGRRATPCPAWCARAASATQPLRKKPVVAPVILDRVTSPIRVIACLDLRHGRVVKGVNFTHLRDSGDPIELADWYTAEGVDELTILDISATVEDRTTTSVDLVEQIDQQTSTPITVGGGIRTVADAGQLVQAGATKVSINTAAIAQPDLIGHLAAEFGSQNLVLALDACRDSDQPSGFGVVTRGGGMAADLDAVDWARRATSLGAGEILATSHDTDGTTNGFDLDLIRAIRAAVDIPVTASGGAGHITDFPAAVNAGADAVLAAGVFHSGTIRIAGVKQALADAGHQIL